MKPANIATILSKSIAVILLTAMLFSCENDIQKVNSLRDIEKLPVNVAKDVEIIYSDSAKIKLFVKSPVMMKYEGASNYMEMPKGLKAFFYNDDRSVKSFLTANYAISYEDTKIIEVKKDVVLVNQRGQKLNTEHLIWNQRERMIHTDKFVKITTKDKIMFGDGLESDESFDKWTILKPRGEILVDQDETTPNNSR